MNVLARHAIMEQSAMIGLMGLSVAVLKAMKAHCVRVTLTTVSLILATMEHALMVLPATHVTVMLVTLDIVARTSSMSATATLAKMEASVWTLSTSTFASAYMELLAQTVR